MIASRIDPAMVEIRGVPYASAKAVIFQRATVIVSEVLYFCSCLSFLNTINAKSMKSLCIVFLVPGLLVVDHLHFQYNGFMFGILIFSLTALHRV